MWSHEILGYGSVDDIFNCSVLQKVHFEFKVKIEWLNTAPNIESMSVASQEYLKEEGGVSQEGVRMIGDLLNEQSLMHLALTEMIYIQSDVSDSTTWDWLI